MTVNCVSDFELTELMMWLIIKLESYFINYFHYSGFIIFVFVNLLSHGILYFLHGVTHI